MLIAAMMIHWAGVRCIYGYDEVRAALVAKDKVPPTIGVNSAINVALQKGRRKQQGRRRKGDRAHVGATNALQHVAPQAVQSSKCQSKCFS